MRSLRLVLGLIIISSGQWLLKFGGKVGNIKVNVERTDIK